MTMSASTPSTAPETVHVAAGVIFDAEGRILISRRPGHLHQGGLWEFPGGKVEPGETVTEALTRELEEELGIRPGPMEPLIAVPWDYPERRVLLDVWRVNGFTGQPQGREGQALARVALESLDDYDFPPADRPVIDALRLPERCLVTPEPAGALARFLDTLKRALDSGIGLVILRAHGLSERDYLKLLEQVAGLRTHWRFLLHGYGAPSLLARAGADGVHLRASELARPEIDLCGLAGSASCHNAHELALASRAGLRFALLSPVAPTRTHPGQPPLGWEDFARLVRQAALPVYALGGLGEEDVTRARRHGGQGVAAMRAFWPVEVT